MKNYFRQSKYRLTNTDDILKCSQIMSHVDELAPSDSSVNAMINQLADGTFHTIIAIQAACGRFYAEAKNSSLLTSLHQAEKNILKSLASWKNVRFNR